MVVKVKPDDENFVVLGGTNLYRSTDGFSSAVSATGSSGWMGDTQLLIMFHNIQTHHPDQHSMVFLTF